MDGRAGVSAGLATRLRPSLPPLLPPAIRDCASSSAVSFFLVLSFSLSASSLACPSGLVRTSPPCRIFQGSARKIKRTIKKIRQRRGSSPPLLRHNSTDSRSAITSEHFSIRCAPYIRRCAGRYPHLRVLEDYSLRASLYAPRLTVAITHWPR